MLVSGVFRGKLDTALDLEAGQDGLEKAVHVGGFEELWKEVCRRKLIVTGEGSVVTGTTGEGSMSLAWSEQHLSCEGCKLMRATLIQLFHYGDTVVVFTEKIRTSGREGCICRQSPGEHWWDTILQKRLLA